MGFRNVKGMRRCTEIIARGRWTTTLTAQTRRAVVGNGGHVARRPWCRLGSQAAGQARAQKRSSCARDGCSRQWRVPEDNKQRRGFLASRADRAKREHEQQQHSDPQDAARISSLAHRNNRNGTDEGAAGQGAPNTRKGPKRLTMAERNAQWKEKRDAKLERMRQKGKEKESGAPPPSGGRFNGKQPEGPGHSGNGNGALGSGHGGSPKQMPARQNVQGGYDTKNNNMRRRSSGTTTGTGLAAHKECSCRCSSSTASAAAARGRLPLMHPCRAQSRRSGRVKCCAECAGLRSRGGPDNPGVFYCAVLDGVRGW